MANERLSSISGFILTVLCLQVPGCTGMKSHTLHYGCSRYTFYASQQKNSVNFNNSRRACKVNGSDLVSIESNEEWNVLKDTIKQFAQSGTEYFIGLTKDKDGRWRWISNNSTVNETYWAPNEPKNRNDERCAVMYKDYNKNYGLFDDLPCTDERHGYICESVLKAGNCSTDTIIAPYTKSLTKTSTTDHSLLTTSRRVLAEPTTKPTTPKESDKSLSATGPHSISFARSPSTNDGSKAIPTATVKVTTSSSHKQFSVEEYSTEPVPNTSRNTNTSITYTNPKPAVPEGVINESPDITVIILILLAVIILALLIVFFIIFSQRRRRNKAKVSSQSGKQPRDRKHYLHSSTELTVHVSMSQAQEERITINNVRENNKEYAYAVVDESKRKSKCEQEGPSSSEGGVQSPPNDDHTAAHQLALKKNTERCDKDDDQKDKGHHVYANVLVKESKAVMFRKNTASRDASLDVTCTEGNSAVGGDPVEHLNRSSLKQGKEINSSEAASEQDPNSGTECNDHFYAVVDKSKKKQMAPKKPLPYSSGHLMYADMSHLPNNKNGKVHRACASTVYADINHSAKRKVKTGWKPRLPIM